VQSLIKKKGKPKDDDYDSEEAVTTKTTYDPDLTELLSSSEGMPPLSSLPLSPPPLVPLLLTKTYDSDLTGLLRFLKRTPGYFRNFSSFKKSFSLCNSEQEIVKFDDGDSEMMKKHFFALDTEEDELYRFILFFFESALVRPLCSVGKDEVVEGVVGWEVGEGRRTGSGPVNGS
jgi:hypothetical protein